LLKKSILVFFNFVLFYNREGGSVVASAGNNIVLEGPINYKRFVTKGDF
jgi:hypothetical protein